MSEVISVKPLRAVLQCCPNKNKRHDIAIVRGAESRTAVMLSQKAACWQGYVFSDNEVSPIDRRKQPEANLDSYVLLDVLPGDIFALPQKTNLLIKQNNDGRYTVIASHNNQTIAEARRIRNDSSVHYVIDLPAELLALLEGESQPLQWQKLVLAIADEQAAVSLDVIAPGVAGSFRASLPVIVAGKSVPSGLQMTITPAMVQQIHPPYQQPKPEVFSHKVRVELLGDCCILLTDLRNRSCLCHVLANNNKNLLMQVGLQQPLPRLLPGYVSLEYVNRNVGWLAIPGLELLPEEQLKDKTACLAGRAGGTIWVAGDEAYSFDNVQEKCLSLGIIDKARRFYHIAARWGR